MADTSRSKTCHLFRLKNAAFGSFRKELEAFFVPDDSECGLNSAQGCRFGCQRVSSGRVSDICLLVQTGIAKVGGLRNRSWVSFVIFGSFLFLGHRKLNRGNKLASFVRLASSPLNHQLATEVKQKLEQKH